MSRYFVHSPYSEEIAMDDYIYWDRNEDLDEVFIIPYGISMTDYLWGRFNPEQRHPNYGTF